MDTMDTRNRLVQLETRLADMRARMPAHSVRPATLMEIEDVEEEIASLRAQLVEAGPDAESPD